jgi:hypothetical protein
MPLTLRRIAELRSQRTCSAEMTELLDAAEALRLLQEAGEEYVGGRFGQATGWYCTKSGNLLSGMVGKDYPHYTPQAAVLAALKEQT